MTKVRMSRGSGGIDSNIDNSIGRGFQNGLPSLILSVRSFYTPSYYHIYGDIFQKVAWQT
jgi:hypothetical protein